MRTSAGRLWVSVGIVILLADSAPRALAVDAAGALKRVETDWTWLQYGLYIHFDISTYGGYVGATDIGKVPAERFAPTSLDVRGWASAARQSGMTFAILTAKHEAGFCLWDSKDYDYDVGSSPAKTDIVATFVAACKTEGIAPGVHYSIPDAYNEGALRYKGGVAPAYFDRIKRHVAELHTNYPDLRVQLFDGSTRLTPAQFGEICQIVTRLNPHCVILGADKEHLGPPYDCASVNKGWLWSAKAELATPQELFEQYQRCMAGGKSFLLNVGPDTSGRIPSAYLAVLTEVKNLIASTTAETSQPAGAAAVRSQDVSPNSPPSEARAALNAAKVRYKASADKIEADKNRALESLTSDYLRQLETLLGKCMDEHNLDDAVAVRAEMDRIRPNAPVSSADLKRGLVLHLAFDAADKEGNVPDQSGQGNHGRAVGAQWTAQGKRGGALQFARNNSYVQVRNQDSLNPAQVTVAAWIKTTYSDNVWRRIVDKCCSQGFALGIGGEVQQWRQRGRVTWEVNGHGGTISDGRIDDGAWHHVVGTFDGSVQRLYVDGRLQLREDRWQGRVAANTHDLTIAANRSNPDANLGEVNASFGGTVDEVMIFGRAMSSKEVAWLAGLESEKQSQGRR